MQPVGFIPLVFLDVEVLIRHGPAAPIGLPLRILEARVLGDLADKG